LEIAELCDLIRQTSYDIHVYLKNGHLEKIYHNALTHRLQKLGLEVKREHPISVYDEDGALLGDFYADLFIENALLIEIKACKTISNEHISQLLGYMRASNLKHGMLINFGAYKIEIKKYIL